MIVFEFRRCIEIIVRLVFICIVYRSFKISITYLQFYWIKVWNKDLFSKGQKWAKCQCSIRCEWLWGIVPYMMMYKLAAWSLHSLSKLLKTANANTLNDLLKLAVPKGKYFGQIFEFWVLWSETIETSRNHFFLPCFYDFGQSIYPCNHPLSKVSRWNRKKLLFGLKYLEG